MLENRNKLGFTLSELITAMGIIGVLAALSVPALFENINKRTFSAHLKNSVAQVEQLANVQMATKGTKDLNLTDFSSPSKLFSDKNFMITKKCSAALAKESCWNNKDKYKSVSGNEISIASGSNTVILKNGQTLSYSNSVINVNEVGVPASKSVKTVGKVCVDLNGAYEKPNIVGRDYFCYYIDAKGRIVGSGNFGTVDASTNINYCKGTSATPEKCFDAVMQSGWHMDY